MKNEMAVEYLENFTGFVPSRVLSEVPMMTAQVLSTVLFKDPAHKRSQMTTTSTDRTYYIVTSSGKVSSYKIIHTKEAPRDRSVL